MLFGTLQSPVRQPIRRRLGGAHGMPSCDLWRMQALVATLVPTSVPAVARNQCHDFNRLREEVGVSLGEVGARAPPNWSHDIFFFTGLKSLL